MAYLDKVLEGLAPVAKVLDLGCGSGEPFAREAAVTERVVAAARDTGLLLYASTGHADGTNGDLVMLGPPFVLSDDEAGLLVERTAGAVRSVS